MQDRFCGDDAEKPIIRVDDWQLTKISRNHYVESVGRRHTRTDADRRSMILNQVTYLEWHRLKCNDFSA